MSLDELAEELGNLGFATTIHKDPHNEMPDSLEAEYLMCPDGSELTLRLDADGPRGFDAENIALSDDVCRAIQLLYAWPKQPPAPTAGATVRLSQDQADWLHGFLSNSLPRVAADEAVMDQIVAALAAAAAPQPEPSEQEIEAGAKALWDKCYSDGQESWESETENGKKYVRRVVSIVLAAARAARQTGREG